MGPSVQKTALKLEFQNKISDNYWTFWMMIGLKVSDLKLALGPNFCCKLTPKFDLITFQKKNLSSFFFSYFHFPSFFIFFCQKIFISEKIATGASKIRSNLLTSDLPIVMRSIFFLLQNGHKLNTKFTTTITTILPIISSTATATITTTWSQSQNKGQNLDKI